MVKTTIKNIKGKVCKSKKCRDNADCKFPFIYNKVKYNECIDSDQGPWCAVTTSENGVFEKSDEWGYCVEDTKNIEKSSSDKVEQIINELYEFNEDKSKKFWEITYSNEGGEYTVRFGKVGSEGRKTTKTDTIKNIEKLIESKKSKGYQLKTFIEKTKSQDILQRRAPISHEVLWKENYSDNLTPKQRANKANISSIDDLQNYDIVINDNEAGYRNNGVYIYKDNELHPLSGEPDDYGSLPEWVEIRKEDCGHSYFSDYLIDHNSYVPFKTSEWKIGKSYVDEEVKPFKFAYKNINVKTEFHREKDGAKAIVSYPNVMISAPWLGGPIEDVKLGSSGSGKNLGEFIENYQYQNGQSIQIVYVNGKDYYDKYLLEPLRSKSSEIIIPKDVIEKATKIVNAKIESYLKREKTLYLESINPCDLKITLPTITVIPLEKTLDKEKLSSKNEHLDQIKDKDIITELYVNDTKFWEIKYSNEGGKYTVRFGKNGSKGRENTKIDTIENIEKLIQSKKSKGYKLNNQDIDHKIDEIEELELKQQLIEEQDKEYEEGFKIDIQSQQQKEKQDKQETTEKKSSSREKTQCEKNIETNVINKFEKGNLYVKKQKIETEEQAQHIVDSLQQKFCKIKKTKKISSSKSSSSSQKKSHKKTQENNSLPGYSLEFKEGNSNKFYKIYLKPDNSVDINFGKIGTKGRNQNIDIFDTKEKAIDYINKQVTQKEGKGYINIDTVSKTHKIEIIHQEKSSSNKKTKGAIIFTKTPMLADKFYDPNVDMEFKQTGDYNKKKWIVFNGDSGERVRDRWIFKNTPTLYATNPIGWFISEKYDGVRAVWNGQNFTSRTKNIYQAPEWFKQILPDNHSLDGELHCGRGCFQKASGITRHLEPNDEDWTTIKYQVFDIPDPDLVNKPFSERIEIYEQVVKECCQKWNSVVLPPGIQKPKECPIEFTKQIKVTDISQAYEIYKSFIERNAEGAMLRSPDSIYEDKRSKFLLKWKPSLDGEAIVIGYNEGSGRLKGRLGTFQVQLINDVTKKVDPLKEFSLSGRLTDDFRNQYRFKDGIIIKKPEKNNEYPIIGDTITLTFMEYTDKGLPRQPIFQRIRDEK